MIWPPARPEPCAHGRRTFLPAVVCLIALLAGCGGGNHDNVVMTPAKDTDADGILDVADRCPTQPETINKVLDRDGCPDVVSDLYPAVRADVESFWSAFFPASVGRPYSPITGFQLFAGTAISPCGTGAGPFYCPVDRVVYLDTPFMEDQIARIGDFAGATIIAHEIGHHVQNLRGLFGTLSIAIELQADCMAGAWAGSAGARGLLEAGDFQEAARALFEAGDATGTPWFAPSAHGTPLQRQQSFVRGFNAGAVGCG
jgi:predicted metalloprotease